MPSRTREIVINRVAQKVFQIEIYLRIKFFIISFFWAQNKKKIIFMEPNLLKVYQNHSDIYSLGIKLWFPLKKTEYSAYIWTRDNIVAVIQWIHNKIIQYWDGWMHEDGDSLCKNHKIISSNLNACFTNHFMKWRVDQSHTQIQHN